MTTLRSVANIEADSWHCLLYHTWGKKWWMRAQKARPSAQEEVKLLILTFCNKIWDFGRRKNNGLDGFDAKLQLNRVFFYRLTSLVGECVCIYFSAMTLCLENQAYNCLIHFYKSDCFDVMTSKKKTTLKWRRPKK